MLGAHNGTVGATTPNTGAFTTITASGNANISANVNVTANVRASYVRANNEVIGNQISIVNGGSLYFTTSANSVPNANYTAFFGNPVQTNTVFIMPGADGTPYSVLGTDGQANTAGFATLGWKTVVTQYLQVTLRNGSSVYYPPTVQRRTFQVLKRDGTTYTTVNIV